MAVLILGGVEEASTDMGKKKPVTLLTNYLRLHQGWHNRLGFRGTWATEWGIGSTKQCFPMGHYWVLRAREDFWQRCSPGLYKTSLNPKTAGPLKVECKAAELRKVHAKHSGYCRLGNGQRNWWKPIWGIPKFQPPKVEVGEKNRRTERNPLRHSGSSNSIRQLPF